jgi:hypothetical protein
MGAGPNPERLMQRAEHPAGARCVTTTLKVLGPLH